MNYEFMMKVRYIPKYNTSLRMICKRRDCKNEKRYTWYIVYAEFEDAI